MSPSTYAVHRSVRMLGFAFFLIAGPTVAQDVSRKVIDVPAVALYESLLTLGELYDVEIVAAESVVGGVSAPSVSGSYTFEEAAAQLLLGTGLELQRSSGGSAVVLPAEGSPPPASSDSPREKQSETAAPEGVEEIIVWGQKRDRSLKDVNASVAVYDNDFMTNTTFTDLTELYQYTPNVQATVADEGDFSIRGIQFRGLNSSGTTNVASLYVDNVFQSTLGIEAGPSGIFDLEQVEVYRGVQSTVQGRNALAGAIYVRTTNPSYEWSGRARAEYADYNTQRLAAAIGGPIIADQLAFRVSWDEYQTDGFNENPVADLDDINFDDTRNRRAKLLFEPEALDGFSALLTYIDSEGLAGTGFGTGTVVGPNFFDRFTAPNVVNPGVLTIDTRNWALDLRQEFGRKLALEFTATHSDAQEVNEPRFGAFDLSTFFDISTDEEVVNTFDLRGTWSDDRLDLLIGLYRFELDRDTSRDLGLPPSNIFFVEDAAQRVENTAIYLDGEYRMTDAWALLFGARYDREDYQQAGVSAFSAMGPIDINSLVPSTTNTDFDAFLPKLGLRWDQRENISASLVYQRGYRAGAAAIDGTNTPYSYDPEYTNNVELAARARFAGGRLSLNANLFYTDWEDQQVIVALDGTSGLLFRVDNAGASELYGLEVDLTAIVSSRLTVFAGLGLLHTEFTDFVDAENGVDYGGNQFPQAPSATASLALLYEHGNGVFANLDARYASSAYSDPQNFQEHKVESYAVVNTKVGYRRNNWSVALFARNLFDEDYLLRIRNAAELPDGPGLWEANVGAPRVVGGELTLSF